MSIRDTIKERYDLKTHEVDDKIRELSKDVGGPNLDGIPFDRCSGQTMMDLLDKIDSHIKNNPKPEAETPS